MTIHQVSRKNDSLTFSLEKEAKHLIVSFIDQKSVSKKSIGYTGNLIIRGCCLFKCLNIEILFFESRFSI